MHSSPRYYGGGGGGAGVHGVGGAGGSGYINPAFAASGSVNEAAGNTRVPPGTSEPGYDGSAGYGAPSMGTGNNGLVFLQWG